MTISRHVILLLSLIPVIAVSCAPKSEKNGNGEKDNHFARVEAPRMLSDEDKVEYIAGHMWDGWVEDAPQEEVEQAMADYLNLLSYMPLDKARKIVGAFAEKLAATESADTSSNVFEDGGALFEKYAFDPNSIVRDEDIYSPYAEYMSSCPLVDEARRRAYAEDARLTSLNRRGTKATDFSFVDRYGHHFTLYGIQARRTIMFFSNPGCTACKEIIDDLNSISEIAEMIESGYLAVVNIYIDEDIAGWMEYMPIYPDSWYNGYDDNHIIRDDELYNIRAIPSLYLLDEDKTVLLKDTTLERVLTNL